jgi:CDP-glucose 4,6-dehydratase
MVAAMGFWHGKRVLLTGHTGFKGSWLELWLAQLGAEVHGLSLPAPTEPSLHALLGRQDPAGRDILDIRDRAAVLRRMQEVKPEIVFHLAAQPLVRASYRMPNETFEINVQGTANLLDAARIAPDLRSIVVVTTDKVYENPETARPFREEDPLGGHDPYSASKAAAEIVVSSYRRSFFLPRGIGVAAARAGNVIGGGDWAEDRLIPDAVRAFKTGTTLEIRRPAAIRPWQHVLEPLGGYMRLAEELWHRPDAGPAYNFGPDAANAASVRDVLSLSADYFDGSTIAWGDGSEGPHEAGYLMLDSTKATRELGFHPKLTLGETLERTWSWYRRQMAGEDARALCLEDLALFAPGAASSPGKARA